MMATLSEAITCLKILEEKQKLRRGKCENAQTGNSHLKSRKKKK